MKTVEAIRGNEEIVLGYYGLHLTGNRHINCGICEKKKSLRINIYNGNIAYICTCSNGDIFQYLKESLGLDFQRIAKDVDSLLGNTFESKEVPNVDSISNKASRRYKSLPAIKGTQGQIYLNSRGIYNMPRGGVKYNPKEGKYQSLYAIATNDDHKPIYLHRTLLDGEKKANVKVSKKMLTLNEFIGSVSIRLFPIQSTLGIAEGIETALSCSQIYKCSTWSALNSSLLKRFKAPLGVDHLIVFADSDRKGAGHAAAFECAHRNMVSNNNVKRVSVRWTAERGDFNDMLNNGSEVFEWILN